MTLLVEPRPSTSTTSKGGPPAGPDLEVVVAGPNVVHPNAAGGLRARYTVTVTNRGSATGGGILSIFGEEERAHGWYGVRRQVGPPCGTAWRSTCQLPRLAPKEARVYTVGLQLTRKEYLTVPRRLRVEAEVTSTDPGDPPGNDRDTDLTDVGR